MWGSLVELASKILGFNDIEQYGPFNQVVICSELEEIGEVAIKIRKGLIPYPPLHIILPSHSEITDPDIKSMIYKIGINLKDGINKFLIAKSKVASKNLELKITYKRKINRKDLNNLVKVEKLENCEAKKVEIRNYSNKKIIGYPIKIREILPFTLSDISDKYKDLRLFINNKLKILDHKGYTVDDFIYYIFIKEKFKIELELLWHVDLEPMETKRYRICYSL